MARSAFTTERIIGRAMPKESMVMVLLYGIGAGLLFPFFRYRIDPDAISYISIAQKYLRGEWTDAVNGFWGPLYSWLLIPFLACRMEPMASAALLSILIGLFALAGAVLLLGRFESSEAIRRGVMLALVPVFLCFALSVRSPDLLVAGILCFYFYRIFDPEYGVRRWDGILCGALGALAYLAKSYAFFFILPHFILLGILHMHDAADQGAKGKILKHCLIGLLAFSLLSGLWITVISLKYGRPTVGTAGAYNHVRTNPASWGSFYLEGVIAAPPNETAVSIMEDPTDLPVPTWNPFESPEALAYQVTVIVKNIHDIFLHCNRVFPLTAAIILGYILLVASRHNPRRGRQPVLFPVLTLLTFPAGYTLFVVNERYLWILFILLILMGAHLLSLVLRSEPLAKPIVRRVALLIFVLTFTIVPVKTIAKEAALYEGRDRYELSNRISARFALSGRLLSDGEWAKTQRIAFHLGCQYYGAAGDELKKSNAGEILRGYGIDHVLLWHTSEDTLPALYGYREISRGEFPGLRIYSSSREAGVD
jgi:hypothetical protein